MSPAQLALQLPTVITGLLQALACLLATDFLSGLVHWAEDAYGKEDLPVLGELVTRRNNLHHQDPSHFARFGWWHSSWLLIAISATVGVIAWSLSLFSWQLGLVLLLGANANQVHKWAHRSRRRNGRLISALMDRGLLPSQAHHARHHTGNENTHYCVLTTWLNPVLDGLGFWPALERAIEATTGIARRDPRVGALPAGRG